MARSSPPLRWECFGLGLVGLASCLLWLCSALFGFGLQLAYWLGLLAYWSKELDQVQKMFKNSVLVVTEFLEIPSNS